MTNFYNCRFYLLMVYQHEKLHCNQIEITFQNLATQHFLVMVYNCSWVNYLLTINTSYLQLINLYKGCLIKGDVVQSTLKENSK